MIIKDITSCIRRSIPPNIPGLIISGLFVLLIISTTLFRFVFIGFLGPLFTQFQPYASTNIFFQLLLGILKSHLSLNILRLLNQLLDRFLFCITHHFETLFELQKSFHPPTPSQPQTHHGLLVH